jgi:hypothetical protein
MIVNRAWLAHIAERNVNRDRAVWTQCLLAVCGRQCCRAGIGHGHATTNRDRRCLAVVTGECAAVGGFCVNEERLATIGITGGGNVPLRQPDQIGIGIRRGSRSETEVIQLHRHLITRRRRAAGRGDDLTDTRAGDVELRHIVAGDSGDLVFAIVPWIRNRIEGR